MREIKASEFKAKCLKLIDEVAETGEAIVVTKRGKAVVRIVGAGPKPKNLFGRGKGTIGAASKRDRLIDILSDEDIEAWQRGDAKIGSSKPGRSTKKSREPAA